MVQTNGDSAVIETSKKAFKCLPDVKAAVEVMSKLKAVGPATASGNHKAHVIIFNKFSTDTCWMQIR